MVAFSNYFFDTTQGHSQINGCTVRNVYIKEAFDTGVRYDFKGNFDLEGLERGIEEVGRITCRISLQPSPVTPQAVSRFHWQT